MLTALLHFFLLTKRVPGFLPDQGSPASGTAHSFRLRLPELTGSDVLNLVNSEGKPG